MLHDIQEFMLLTGTKVIGSSAGAAHLSNDNAGVRNVGSTWAETSCGLEGDMLP